MKRPRSRVPATSRRARRAGAPPTAGATGARAGAGSGFTLDAPAGATPWSERGWTWLAGAAVALFAAAALFMIAGPHRIGDYMTETDFYGSYAEGARLVQHGRIVPARYGVVGPVYEIALALAGFVVRDLFVAAELISLVAAVAALVLWFVLLRRLSGAMAAAFAVLFVASNAHFLRYAYSATTDALALALQAATLAVLFGAGGGRRTLAAGGLVALAFLTRYNAIYLLPAGLIAILAGRAGTPPRGRAALLFAVGFAVPVGAWIAYSLTHGGAFSFQLHHNIAYEVFARARGIVWDDYQRTLQSQFPTLWHVIARDPGAVAVRIAFNVFDHLRRDATQLLGGPVVACAALGFAFGLRDGGVRRLWPVLAAAGLLFLTLVPVFYSERYSLALLPAYAALAALAVASPTGALAFGTGRRRWLKPWLAAAPLALALTGSARLQAHVVSQLPVEVLTVGRTLRRLGRPGDRVIARKSHIAYYGGVTPAPFPFADSLADLARSARAAQARWLFFSWPEAEMRPRFWYLLDTTAAVPGLTPRAATVAHPAVLYEIGDGFGASPAWIDNDTLATYHTLRARLLVDASNNDLVHQYAVAAHLLGRDAEARRMLELLVSRRPNDIGALLLLGRVFLAQQAATDAANVFERVLRLDPNNAPAGIGRGWAALLAGREREAASVWRPLIAIAADSVTLDRMETLYGSLGDREAERAARARLETLGGAR